MSRALSTTVLLALSVGLASAADAPKPAPSPATPAAAPAAPAAPSATVAPAAPSVVTKNVDAIHALIIPMKGSYQQHGDAFGQLFGQLGAQGVNPLGPPFGRYLNTPAEVAEADLAWEIGVPVAADVKATAPLQIRDIPATSAATLLYQGPPDGLAEPWQQIATWVGANGYRATGPVMMMFLGEPGPEGMRVEFRVPIEKTK